MISTRLVELVIDTVLCLTLAKWETVSGQFGGYLSWGHFRLGARSCPMHDARRDSGSASPAIVRRVGGWSSGLGGCWGGGCVGAPRRVGVVGVVVRISPR